MTNQLDIETKVIQRFVVSAKRERYLGFIRTLKSRHKFTSDLGHFKHLQNGLFENVTGNVEEIILGKIKQLGSLNDCYLISESPILDQKRLPIDVALSETIGSGMGTLIVFGDAEIVYYEGEGPNERCISVLTKN